MEQDRWVREQEQEPAEEEIWVRDKGVAWEAGRLLQDPEETVYVRAVDTVCSTH